MALIDLLDTPPVRPSRIRPTNLVSTLARRRANELLESGNLSQYYGGPWSHQFENEFAQYYGADFFAVAVNSGTSALHLSISACEIGPGDEVIVPALSFVAAATIVAQNEAIPVVCDAEERSLTMDVQSVKKAITERTKAVVAVHYRGYPADLQALRQLCDEQNLMLVEDCAQSFGARVGDRLAGSFGDFSAFSFSTNKHVSCGEGGIVLCRSKENAGSLREKSNYGKGPAWDDFRTVGFNYRMPEFSAIIGLDSLSRCDEEVGRRIAVAELYCEAISDSGCSVVPEPIWGRASFFRFPLLLGNQELSERESVARALSNKNINCWIPHPPLNRIAWLRQYLRDHEDLRADIQNLVAEQASRNIIEIETGPNLSADEAEKTARALALLAS